MSIKGINKLLVLQIENDRCKGGNFFILKKAKEVTNTICKIHVIYVHMVVSLKFMRFLIENYLKLNIYIIQNNNNNNNNSEVPIFFINAQMINY